MYVFRLCSIALSANISRKLISKEDGSQASSVTIGDLQVYDTVKRRLSIKFGDQSNGGYENRSIVTQEL